MSHEDHHSLSLKSWGGFLTLIWVSYCFVTKHSKLNGINNNLVTLTDSVGREFRWSLAGMTSLYAAIGGNIDSGSAGGDSNGCRLELSGDFFIHPCGTWVGMTLRLEHLHLDSLCGLDFLPTWSLGSKTQCPWEVAYRERVFQGNSAKAARSLLT